MKWIGLDEKIDVFSLGNNIFALLTGRRVSLEKRDQKQAMIQYAVSANAYFKTRSFAERKLVDIMTRCWDFDPATRASIFDVVEFLREAIEQDNRRNFVGGLRG
jgi:hypothetical protein